MMDKARFFTIFVCTFALALGTGSLADKIARPQTKIFEKRSMRYWFSLEELPNDSDSTSAYYSLLLMGDMDGNWGGVGSHYFNYQMADRICVEVGFEWAHDWRSNDNYEFASWELLRQHNITKFADNLFCPDGNARSFVNDCDYDLDEPGNGTDLVVIRCFASDNYWGYQEISLANIDDWGDVIFGQQEGLLIAKGQSKGDLLYWGSVTMEGFNYVAADLACFDMGFGKSSWWDYNSNGRYYNNTDPNFEVAGGINCPDYADDLQDCKYYKASENFTHDQDVLLGCFKPEPKPEPSGNLTFHLLNRNGDKFANNGLVIVTDNDVVGTWRYDDFGMPYDAAHVICRELGLNQAEYMEPHWIQFDSDELEGLEPRLHDVVCKDPKGPFSDCEYVFDKYIDSIWTEATVLYCYGSVEPTDGPTPEKVEVYFELIMPDEYGYVEVDENQGLVVAMVVYNDDWNNMKYGSVCLDSVFNSAAADVVCKSKGHKGADYYTDNADYSLISEENLIGLEVVVDDFYCKEGASDMSSCYYNLFKTDCSHEQDLVVVCKSDGEKDDWKLTYASMWRYDEQEDEFFESNPGLLIINAESYSGDRGLGGTVCSEGFNDYSANIICQMMGYRNGSGWMEHQFDLIPEYLVNDVPVVATNFSCPRWADSYKDCNITFVEGSCTHKMDVVLFCDGDIRPTYPPYYSSSPYGDLSFNFGGVKAELEVSPRKGKARLIDVLEEIFG